MMGVCLFLGFLAGIAVTLLAAVTLPKIAALLRREPDPETARAEDESLVRMRRQLAEIERYSGGPDR